MSKVRMKLGPVPVPEIKSPGLKLVRNTMSFEVAGEEVTTDLGPMLTLGVENLLALRVTKGTLDRHARWHNNRPCVFLLVRGMRWP